MIFPGKSWFLVISPQISPMISKGALAFGPQQPVETMKVLSPKNMPKKTRKKWRNCGEPYILLNSLCFWMCFYSNFLNELLPPSRKGRTWCKIFSQNYWELPPSSFWKKCINSIRWCAYNQNQTRWWPSRKLFIPDRWSSPTTTFEGTQTGHQESPRNSSSPNIDLLFLQVKDFGGSRPNLYIWWSWIRVHDPNAGWRFFHLVACKRSSKQLEKIEIYTPWRKKSLPANHLGWC